MKKDIGAIRLTLTYAGCMIGAGFVSGQELTQYFGAYGRKGLSALLFSLALLGGMTILAVALSRKTGETTMDALIVLPENRWLRAIVGFCTSILLFGITGIMIAGIGALGVDMLGVPQWIGNAVIAILLGVFTYFGFNGMLAVFSAAVPVLIVATVVITGLKIASGGVLQLGFPEATTNPMLGGWFLSALNYTALNYYGTMAVMPPLAERYKMRATLPLAVMFGTLALLLIALGVIFALSLSPLCMGTELPMLTLARELGEIPGALYAILLFLGMFGVAVSNTVVVENFMETKSERIRRRRNIAIPVLVVAAYAGSLLGFSSLISYVYPIYGYVGIAVIVIVIVNYLSVRTRRSDKQGK